ncbi:MAG: NAD-dependent epimerase/dehydratase family protein [Acidimicrobiia bacterium]
MKIVVLGATGNVGKALVERLVTEPGHEVVGVARRSPGGDWPGDFHEADVRIDDLTAVLHRADAVVHLAWFFQPTHDPAVTWQNNVVGTERVLAAAAAAEVATVMVASSVGAYSPGPPVDDDGARRRVDELWPTHSTPTAAYGREKAYVERLLDRFEVEWPTVRVLRMRPSFMLRRGAATEQRRIFAGPFVPRALVTNLPVLPYPRGLEFQALHTDDAVEAFARALTSGARGAFNLAAEPVLDGARVAELLGTRLVEVPRRVVRTAIATAWHARVAPAEPALFDLVCRLPLLDTTRAREELGWTPRRRSTDAITEFVEGLRHGAGDATVPLAPDGVVSRAEELASGVGGHPLG